MSVIVLGLLSAYLGWAWTLVLLAACAIVYLLSAPVRAVRAWGVPTAPMWPVLGCLPFYLRVEGSIWDAHLALSKRHGGGPVGACMPGFAPWLVVSDPPSVRHALKDAFDCFEKGAVLDPFRELVGYGIFGADGEAWARQRKAASHLFAQRVLREDMARMIGVHLDELVERADALAASGEVFDAQRLMFCFTFDTISDVAFGGKPGSLDGRPVPFMESFDRAQQLCTRRQSDPLFRVKRRLGVGSERELARHARVVREYARAAVEERRRAGPDELRRHGDLLSRFAVDAPDWPDEVLAEAVLNYMIAGRDTTAALLSWSLFRLTQMPAERERLLDEMRAAAADPACAAEPTRLAARLVRLEAFLLEVLRLHPPVPGDGKMCVRETRLPNGVLMKPGQLFFYNAYTFGRLNSEAFPEPLELRPERHLAAGEDGAPRVSPPDPFVLPVFNAGPRACLGRRLALMEAKLVLARLLPRYDVELECAPADIGYEENVILRIKGGLPVSLRRRSAE